MKDRVVLVAGSSRGIGLATAVAFAREGARVVVSGRSAAALAIAERTVAGTGASVIAFEGDLTEPAAIEQCMERVKKDWGEIEIVVANIGTGAGTRGFEAGDDEWQRLLEANLLGAVRLVRACVPGMIRRGGGTVVLVSSIAALEALPAPLAYTAAKAALAAYGGALARELAPSGIRVNTIAPGNVLFPGGSWERRQAADPDGTDRYIAAEVPMGRFGRPVEIADAIVFLASPRASFVAGAVLPVDGAQTRGWT